MIMTEDEGGKIKATEEKELMQLNIEDFFMKLAVFTERMDKRIEQLKNKKQNG